MNKKRSRSVNWDEEEKQLLRTILKENAHAIENKSLNTNSNQKKKNAWREVHKKFNEMNYRVRGLTQLQAQWKAMKIATRKNFSGYKKESSKTGGGPKPPSPTNVHLELIDLNPGELIRDFNKYDSDGVIPAPEPQPDEKFNEEIEDQLINSNQQIIYTPLTKTKGDKILNKKDYANAIITHSKLLKDEEHQWKMQMMEDEHKINMEIKQEQLRCAKLERQILEIRMQNYNNSQHEMHKVSDVSFSKFSGSKN